MRVLTVTILVMVMAAFLAITNKSSAEEISDNFVGESQEFARETKVGGKQWIINDGIDQKTAYIQDGKLILDSYYNDKEDNRGLGLILISLKDLDCENFSLSFFISAEKTPHSEAWQGVMWKKKSASKSITDGYIFLIRPNGIWQILLYGKQIATGQCRLRLLDNEITVESKKSGYSVSVNSIEIANFENTELKSGGIALVSWMANPVGPSAYKRCYKDFKLYTD